MARPIDSLDFARRRALMSVMGGLFGSAIGMFANAADSIPHAKGAGAFGVMGFFAKKPGMTLADFIDYYEGHHAPLICRLGALPLLYTRRYLQRGERFIEQGGAMIDFDVVTEIVFADRARFDAWVAQLDQPGPRAEIAQDETRLFDRARMQAHAFEERVTRTRG